MCVWVCVCARACMLVCAFMCVCPPSRRDRKRASERNSKEKLEREQSLSEGECAHLLCLCRQPCAPSPLLTPHFPGYFSYKCCSTHCRGSHGGGGGTESSRKDGRSAASQGLRCEFRGLCHSLRGFWIGCGGVGTEPREQGELKVHEHAHTGMRCEHKTVQTPWCIMHEALPKSAHLTDNYLCQINYQFKCQQEDVDEIHPDYLD